MQFLVLISIVFMLYTNSYSMKEEQLEFTEIFNQIVQRSTEKILNTEFLSEDGVKTKLSDNENITKEFVDVEVSIILKSELSETKLKQDILSNDDDYLRSLFTRTLPFVLFYDYQNNNEWTDQKSNQYKLLEALFHNFAECYEYLTDNYLLASCLQFFEDGLTEKIIKNNSFDENFLPKNRNPEILKNIRQAFVTIICERAIGNLSRNRVSFILNIFYFISTKSFKFTLPMEEPEEFKVFSDKYTKLLANFDELNNNLALVLFVINPPKTSDIELNRALQDAMHRFFLVVKTNIVSFLDCFSRTENDKMPFFYFYRFIDSLSTTTDFNDFLDLLLTVAESKTVISDKTLQIIVNKLIDIFEADKENKAIETKLNNLVQIIKSRYPSIINYYRQQIYNYDNDTEKLIGRYIKYFGNKEDIQEEIDKLEEQKLKQKTRDQQKTGNSNITTEFKENISQETQQNIKTRLLNWIHKHPYPTIFAGGIGVSLIIFGILAKYNKFKLQRPSWPFSWPSFTK